MSGAQETKAQREQRLADALRANLRRRKDQARERRSGEDGAQENPVNQTSATDHPK